jgi:hypothetical protein
MSHNAVVALVSGTSLSMDRRWRKSLRRRHCHPGFFFLSIPPRFNSHLPAARLVPRAWSFPESQRACHSVAIAAPAPLLPFPRFACGAKRRSFLPVPPRTLLVGRFFLYRRALCSSVARATKEKPRPTYRALTLALRRMDTRQRSRTSTWGNSSSSSDCSGEFHHYTRPSSYLKLHIVFHFHFQEKS